MRKKCQKQYKKDSDLKKLHKYWKWHSYEAKTNWLNKNIYFLNFISKIKIKTVLKYKPTINKSEMICYKRNIIITIQVYNRPISSQNEKQFKITSVESKPEQHVKAFRHFR